jgi:hypothetical protein
MRHSSTPSPSSDHISQFELRALAFADLIERVINDDVTSASPSPPSRPSTDLTPFSTIRCICGAQTNAGDLVQCHDCHCYLHSECLDRVFQRTGQFRCPFCAIQLDGTDPFRELGRWLNVIVDNLKTLHTRVTEAGIIESQLSGSGPRQGTMQLKNSLSRAIQEINENIAVLVNQ